MIFKKYIMVTHLLQLKHICSERPALYVLAAKQAISLLRYSHMLNPEMVFYEAGRLAKVRRQKYPMNRYYEGQHSFALTNWFLIARRHDGCCICVLESILGHL